jgi:DNA-binding transcriptional regulator YiaG
VSETSILEWESVDISWDIQNAQSCWMNGESVPTQKSYTEYPVAWKYYYLYCTRGNKRTTLTHWLKVQVKQVSVSLSADTTSIQSGESVKLSWDSTNATSCNLDSQTLATSWELEVNPITSRWYTLYCKSPSNTRVASQYIRIQAPQITANLSVSSSTITQWESTKITWSSINASNCTLNGESVALSGNNLVSPNLTQSYILVCDSAVRSLIITVQPPQITANLSASSSTINKWESTTLTWNTQNTQNCTLNGENVSNTGNKLVKPELTQHYILKCNSVLKSVFITVQQPQITANLSASSTAINKWESTTLTWNTQNTQNCTLNGENVSNTGNKLVKPESTQHYTLTCDSVLKSVFIRIQKTSTLPVYVLPSIEIKKSATFLKPGQSAQVTWNASSGATSCVLSWDASNTSTSWKVNIIPSKKWFNSYTIVCKYSNWPHPYKRGFTLYQK